VVLEEEKNVHQQRNAWGADLTEKTERTWLKKSFKCRKRFGRDGKGQLEKNLRGFVEMQVLIPAKKKQRGARQRKSPSGWRTARPRGGNGGANSKEIGKGTKGNSTKSLV